MPFLRPGLRLQPPLFFLPYAQRFALAMFHLSERACDTYRPSYGRTCSSIYLLCDRMSGSDPLHHDIYVPFLFS